MMQVASNASGLQVVTREKLMVDRPKATFAPGFRLDSKLRKVGKDISGNTLVEFISTDNFAADWYSRQRYEVDAGRDLEPVLYTSIYDEVIDSTLPRNVPIFRIGPAGVVFEEVQEGGEVKFASMGSSQIAVPIKQYAFGIEYSKQLMMYNELWSLSEVERQAGTAFNALQNHIHLYPILTHAYGAANQTPASAVGANLLEKYLRTIEDAITSASVDEANPRRGPYILLMSTSNFFTMERALTVVFQQGTTVQSSAIGQISQVIAYNGWTGVRGKKSVTYAGVTANKAYLIDTGYRARNFKSFVKQPLQSTTGNPDISRFILEQTVWDSHFGIFADPAAAVEEITLPTS